MLEPSNNLVPQKEIVASTMLLKGFTQIASSELLARIKTEPLEISLPKMPIRWDTVLKFRGGGGKHIVADTQGDTPSNENQV